MATDKSDVQPDTPPVSWSFGRFSRRTALLQKFALLRMINSFTTYQPIDLGGKQVRAGDRECSDRWHMIEKAVSNVEVNSLLDLGCAEGYFVRKAASQLNCIALGVDADARRISVARGLASFDGTTGVGYILEYITPKTVRKLPMFDVVIFCSVLHHVMFERGVDEARELMAAVRACTRSKLIFDMGQSNEVNHEWSSKLPRMEPDPAVWISQFLKESGFTSVEVIGETAGYLGAYPRKLFVAST